MRKQQKQLRKKTDQILGRLGLLKDKYTPAYLSSGGQRKLLEFGRALMSNPQMLLLDEPTSGLQPGLAAELFKEIKSINKRGVSVLLVEQRAKKR